MFIHQHLSRVSDGCFYLTLSILVSCSTSSKIPDDNGQIAPEEMLTSSEQQLPAQHTKQQQAHDSGTVTFKIAAVGDIMLGTNYPFNHLPEPGIDLLADVKTILQNTDISFGNLEGVLLEEGEPVKTCEDLKRCYVFKSPIAFAKLLKGAGFTMLSLANNHARDFGEVGRLSTMAALDAQGIQHSGMVGDVARITIRNRQFVMIAFAPFRGANDMLDVPLARIVVSKLAAQNDVVIVSMHGGAEGEDKTRLPFATEYFYQEDRGDVVEFAHAMIDSGADIVLGHGPHVPRALELYKDRIIAYSLGNFATYYGISVQGQRGLAPILELEISEQGHFLSGKIHSFRQNRPQGPQRDHHQSSTKLFQQLTAQDFPTGLLQISNNGELLQR